MACRLAATALCDSIPPPATRLRRAEPCARLGGGSKWLAHVANTWAVVRPLVDSAGRDTVEHLCGVWAAYQDDASGPDQGA